MPFIALLALGAMFAGVVYMRDDRESIRRMAKAGVVLGAIVATLVAMATIGPMAALFLFAAFVAASFWTQFWS